MATTTKATISSNILVKQTKPKEDFVSDSNVTLKTKSSGYTRTTTFEVPHAQRLTIAASSNVDIDLSGVLEDLWGDAAIFTAVKGLTIINHSDNPIGGEISTAADITINGSWIHSCLGGVFAAIHLGAGGQWNHYDPTGSSVTDITTDTITITNNSGTDIAYVDIVIVGDNT